ncbi:MAG TPA: class I SAM-dependent methyltransferase [Solirubrobacteraceae bacterium]|nr:class I SAM-dependent methyltransferase [Solirubrobacteraceae bacterium]
MRRLLAQLRSRIAARRVPPAAAWAVRRIRELIELIPARGPLRLEAGGMTGRAGPAAGDAVPLPPRRLRARAGAPGAREYREGGARAAGELAAALAAAGRELSGASAILDFGCGAGRVLPHVAALAGHARVSGCDVDAAAIAWAAEHRPGADWAVSSFEPPLPYPEGRFDLVYAISVFSHLGRGLQDRWLAEIRRVLAPGGTALLSVHGPSAFDAFRAGDARTSWCRPELFRREPLRSGDFVFVPYQRSPWTNGDLPGVGREYGLAFHGHDFIRQTWSAQLEVTAIAPRAVTGWQDLVVAVRPGT